MMESLRTWLSSIVAVTLLIAMAESLVPEGTMRRVAGFTGGLVLLLALVRPVLAGGLPDLTLETEAWTKAIEDQQASLSRQGEDALAALIAERTASYIWDKGAALGLEVKANVETRTGEAGLPVPERVELEGPYSKELADYITHELNIPPERQVWNEQEN